MTTFDDNSLLPNLSYVVLISDPGKMAEIGEELTVTVKEWHRQGIHRHEVYASSEIRTANTTNFSQLLKSYLENIDEATRSEDDFIIYRDHQGGRGHRRVLEPLTTLISNGVEDGDHIHVFYIKRSWLMRCCDNVFEGQGCWRYFCLILGALAVIGCLASTVTLLYFTVTHQYPLESGVVIDAGSMHSSVTVYQWQQGQSSDMREMFSCEFEDLRGVTSFINQPSKVQDYIRDSRCLAAAMEKANLGANSSRLYLGCTGGMRSALRSKPVLANQLIANLTVALDNVGVNFNVQGVIQETKLEVLDGVDEGVYGWVTVNADALANQAALEQVGSLDWGGASSQISFPAAPDLAASEYDHVRNVKVFKKLNKVYSISQLCYGQNSALQRYFVQLMHGQFKNSGKIGSTYSSPCHPKRISSYKVKGEQLMSTCTRLRDEKFNEALIQAKNRTIQFIGSGDQERCEAMVKDQFDVGQCKSTYEEHRTCFNAGMVARPPSHLKFYAFSTYWYLAEVLKVPAAKVSEVDSVSMTMSDLDGILEKVCLKTTKTLTAVSATWGSEPAHNSCFRAVFMRRLLTQGYGFKNWTNIEFVSKVGGASVGWSRGYLLAHLGDEGLGQPILRCNEKAALGFMTFFGGLFALVCFGAFFPKPCYYLVWYTIRKPYSILTSFCCRRADRSAYEEI